MKELKITKGEWEDILLAHDISIPIVSKEESLTIAHVTNGNEFDAQLIAEAGTVANQTGLMPSELLELVRDMQIALSRTMQGKVVREYSHLQARIENALKLKPNE